MSVAALSVDSAAELAEWAARQDEWDGDELTVTFVVLTNGVLRVAPRRSEHVDCAGALELFAAGELTLRTSPSVAVVAATNQSTGYCPAPESFAALAAALRSLGISGPEQYTTAFEFRRCSACRERNLVKERWFVCASCGAPLAAEWNFDDAPERSA